jgi:dienelactone hydrolase
MDPSVRKTPLGGQDVSGNLFIPRGSGPFPALIILGSQGGPPPDSFVAQFANKGYAALGLAYYKSYGLPDYNSNIPLEYFIKAINYLKGRSDNDPGRIGIVGDTFGGTAALLVASKNPDLKGVASIMGSGVLFQSSDTGVYQTNSASPFTFEGKPLPFIPIDAPRPSAQDLQTQYFLKAFLGSLFRQPSAVVDSATIDVSKIQGAIIMFAGLDDQFMGSSYLLGLSYNRLAKEGAASTYDLFIYNGVGHTLGINGLPNTPCTSQIAFLPNLNIYFPMGGIPWLTTFAQSDSWSRLFEFLDKNVKNAPSAVKK